MKQYLKRTWKNKLVALLLVGISHIPLWIEKDATVLIMAIIIAVPLFFANRNYIE